MKLTQCSNGHFYDAEKFATCPHCSGMNAGPGAAERVTVPLMRKPEEMNATVPETAPAQPAVKPDDGKTEAYIQWKRDESTQSADALKNLKGRKPVVGWLVCIEGDYYGESFNLCMGRNFIGRSETMDVALTGDMTVSREKHAVIIYEPKQRKFFAQPGESHELFYLNDEVVLESRQIKDRDVLMIGRSKLVFVPFCDETYGWEK